MLVTEEHLDAAIEDQNGAASECCVLAKALKKRVGLDFELDYVVTTGGESTKLDENGQRIAGLFDNDKFDELRKILPLEVELKCT